MVDLKCTIVWEQNWHAINKDCETCGGTGKTTATGSDCSWCHGSGKYYKYIINKGSSRSSKTISLIDCCDLYARQHKSKRITIWRDTKRICVDTILNDLKKHFKRTGRWLLNHEFNKTNKALTYRTDSTLEFYGADDEETVHGLEQDVSWLNEPYKIAREVFNQIDQRTSDFMFIDYNPKKGHWVEDVAKDDRAIVLESTFKDNPFCPPEQRRKILSYQPVKMSHLVESGEMTESDAIQYDFETNPGQYSETQLNELTRCIENEHKNSASAFNWQVYGLGTKAERPNRIFRFEEVADNYYFNLDSEEYTITDWGAVDPWAIVNAKYYDGALYLHEINYQSENELRERMGPTELAQIRGEEEGIVSYMFNKLGIDKKREIICDNNRPLKIAILRRSGWHALPAVKVKGSILDGIDGVNSMRVYYTKSSVNIAYEQENYSRKVDTKGKVLDDPEDVDNHLMDCVRYFYFRLVQKGIIKKA